MWEGRPGRAGNKINVGQLGARTEAQQRGSCGPMDDGAPIAAPRSLEEPFRGRKIRSCSPQYRAPNLTDEPSLPSVTDCTHKITKITKY